VEDVPFTELLRLPIHPERARIYCEGWQSWSPTTTYRLTDVPINPTSQASRRSGYGGTRPAAPAEVFQGEGLLIVDPGTGEPPVTVGATDPVDIPVLRAIRDGNALLLQSDRAARLDTTGTTLAEAQAAFAGRFAKVAGVGPIRPAPTIWCSWYHYFTGVTEADLVENIAAIDRLRLPVDVVQLDDGYQAEIGDWLELSERFGSLSDIVGRAADTGRRTGIWIAPFLAGARSAVAARHPDWLLRAGGEPLVAIHNWGQDVFALDVSHPGVVDHLRQVFGHLRGLGIDFFKIDFVYAAALDADRHADSSGVQAYRDGLRLVRESIGDAYLLGCGAPILPSVGMVDAMRISPDTAPHWAPIDGDLAKPGGAAAVLTGTARAWQHGRFWVNDPDCLLARPRVERRAELAEHVRRHGGLRGCSDRIAELDEWGLAVTRELLSAVPAPTPFDLNRRSTELPFG
jgi:alpha-galactosidase